MHKSYIVYYRLRTWGLFNSNLSFDDEWITLNFTLKMITLLSYGHMLFLMLKIINAFMTSTLDYSNALLSGCPAGSINKLQLVQNAAGIFSCSHHIFHQSPLPCSLGRLKN